MNKKFVVKIYLTDNSELYLHKHFEKTCLVKFGILRQFKNGKSDISGLIRQDDQCGSKTKTMKVKLDWSTVKSIIL